MITHLDNNQTPRMVDVGEKAPTVRTAKARAIVYLPLPIVPTLREGDELKGPKGPIFQTAVVAGIMGAKKTSELIPLCHPLALEKCDVHLKIVSDTEVEITCFVRTTGKTGVEMEALTGATTAALTLYDMCKALSHGIEIREIVLLEKKGGKKDYVRGAPK